jgi:hypothetical protein
MSEHPYKEFQRLYHELVRDHADDFSKMEIVEEEELVQNALKYFEKAEFPLIYPAKSYAVAIIYGLMLKKTYGIPITESLADPDLFMGHDQYFRPYNDETKDTYQSILAELYHRGGDDYVLTSGWAPQTVKYFHAECTEDGLNQVMEEQYGSQS